MAASTEITCLSCGCCEVTAKNPERYPYCRNCHYTGVAAEHIRGEQLGRFRAAMPEAKIAIEHTGGGCFWLAFYFDGEPAFYTATDANGVLPTDPDLEATREGGWGLVCRNGNDEDSPDYDGTPILDSRIGVSDEEIVRVIRTDRERQNFKPEVGMRLRLRHDVDRFPHFIAPAGSLGTVYTTPKEAWGLTPAKK